MVLCSQSLAIHAFSYFNWNTIKDYSSQAMEAAKPLMKKMQESPAGKFVANHKVLCSTAAILGGVGIMSYLLKKEPIYKIREQIIQRETQQLEKLIAGKWFNLDNFECQSFSYKGQKYSRILNLKQNQQILEEVITWTSPGGFHEPVKTTLRLYCNNKWLCQAFINCLKIIKSKTE